MKTTISMDEFLKEEEINKDIMKNVISECSKYNNELESFLETHSWRHVPSYALREFLKLYQASNINLKTGKIIKPSSLIQYIPIIIFENINIGVDISSHVIEEDIDFDIIIQEKDENNNLIDVSYYGSRLRPGIDFEFYARDDYYSFFDEVAFLQMKLIDPATKKIEILVSLGTNALAIKDSIDGLLVSILNENEVLEDIDLTKEINEKSEVMAFQLLWDINDWRIISGPIRKDDK